MIIKVDNSIINYGTIYCISCLKISCVNSSFLYNTISDIGGAIGLSDVNSKLLYDSLNVSDCKFVGNIVRDTGGSIYLKNTNAKFSNSFFSENQAKIGAAIF